MPFGWYVDTIVRLRAPLVPDGYGDGQLRDWGQAVSTPLTGWRVQPVQSARAMTAETIPRDGLDRSRRAFGPYDVDLVQTDRIEWAGAVWVIDSDIDQWRGPTGRIAHTEILLTRMEG